MFHNYWYMKCICKCSNYYGTKVSVMKQESSLAKTIMLKLLSHTIWIGHINDHLKKISKFHKSFMREDCMSFKGPEEMVTITSTINALMFIKILDTFLVSLIENWFGDDEVIFPDNNAYCYRSKVIKAFLQE